jgi:signal transduction histidine kinase
MKSSPLLLRLLLLYSIWLPLLLVGWHESAHAQQHLADRTGSDTAPTYTAVVLRNFPPLYTIDKDMKPDGYAIDILRQVAARAGFSVTFLVVDNWAQAADAVQSRQGDLVPAYGVTPATSKRFFVSDVVETVPVSVFVRAGTTDIHGIDSLQGRKTAVLSGGSAERVLMDNGVRIVSMDQVETALMGLLSGEVNAFVFPRPVLMQKLRSMGIEDKLKVVGPPLHELQRSFILRKQDSALGERINVAIRDYMGSDQHLADYVKWYGQAPSFWTPKRIAWAMGGLLVLGVVIFSSWHFLAQRRLNLKLEERVRQRTRELEEANQQLEAFSYSVSHDLRAPLRAIDGFTQILVEDYAPRLDAEANRVCTIISDNSRKMSRLIDDLLAFSRLGRASLQITEVDMRALVAEVYEELTTPAERERIDFHCEALPQAMGDRKMLHQVWANLLSNAIKFSSKRERAGISVDATEQQDEIVYCVRDNGAGFDVQYVDKIFAVFQRLHTEREFPGTGVGLALVQRIIARHGGRIWAEGARDQGAVFYFTLQNERKTS